MTTFQQREALPQLASAEHYRSDEIYGAVMEQALPLVPDGLRERLMQRGARMEGKLSDRDRRIRAYMDRSLGKAPVALDRLPLVSYGHLLLESNQAVRPRGSYKTGALTHELAVKVEEVADVKVVDIASAGNAANSLQHAAEAIGEERGEPIDVVLHCTGGASPVKVASLEARGAIVKRISGNFGDARNSAVRDGQLPGHVTVDAYDSVATMAGHFRIFWETVESLLDAEERGEINLRSTPVEFVLPVGGGGFLAAMASGVRWLKEQGVCGDNVQVFGVQMEGCDALKRYRDYVLRGETPPADLFAPDLGLPSFTPAADGTAVNQPGKRTRAVASDPDFVADVFTVSEGELGLAMAALTDVHGYRIEPAGALSLAGAQQRMCANPAEPRKAERSALLTFTTGANVSDELYNYFMGKAEALLQERAEVQATARDAYRAGMYALSGAVVDDELGRAKTRRRGSAPAPSSRGGTRVGHSPVGPR